jgi:hypothetical protein
MTDQELQNYVKDQLNKGVDPGVLRMALESEGLSTKQINDVLVGKSAPAAIQVPNTQTLSAVSAPAPVSLQEHKNSGPGFFANKTLWITVIVLLLVLGGGAYAYTLITPSPEKVSQKMLEGLAQVKSLDFDTSIKGEVKTYQAGVGDAERVERTYSGEISISGTSDMADPNDPRASFVFKLDAEGFNVEVEARTVDKSSYFKVAKFPALGFFDLNGIKDQWIRIDYEYLKEQYGLEDGQFELPAWEDSINPQQIQKIRDVYAKYPMIVLGEKLASEKIDGTNTHHYKFSINEPNVRNFIKEVMSILDETFTQDAKDQDARVVLEKYVDEMFKAFHFTEGEVWVGKSDFLPRRVIMPFELKNPDEPEMGSAKFTLTANLKNFNRATKVEAPYPFKDIQDVFKDMFGTSLEDAGLQSQDATRISHVRQLMTAMELYFNDNGQYPPEKNGRPDPDKTIAGSVGFQPMSFKDFISVYPEYPAHSKNTEGPCKDNTAYVYKRPAPSSYTLTFCLENDSGGFKAGDHTASPAGIQ